MAKRGQSPVHVRMAVNNALKMPDLTSGSFWLRREAGFKSGNDKNLCLFHTNETVHVYNGDEFISD